MFGSKNIRISLLTFFDNKCTFEDNVFIDRFCYLHSCEIGRYTYISYNSSANDCTVGRFCSIADGVNIGLPKHPLDRVSTSPVFYSFNNRFGVKWNKDDSVIESKHTFIGNDVWIGTNSLILCGIKVGDGAVIAAGAVVTKDVEPYTIVGGVPAKVLKARFDKDTINELQKIKWWDKETDYLKKYAKYFKDTVELLNYLKSKSI